MSRELQIDILQDSPDVIRRKLEEIQRRNAALLPGLIEDEMNILDKLVKKLNPYLPHENLTGKMGRQIYHFNTDRDERWVSPDIFYTFDGNIIYEVWEKEKYLRVARSANIIDLPPDPETGRYRGYCAVPVRSFLMNIVPLEEIVRWLSAYMNMEYEDYVSICARCDLVGRSTAVPLPGDTRIG